MNKTETQPKTAKVKRAHSVTSKKHGSVVQSPAKLKVRTNHSQKNATPLSELSNRRRTPTTKLDEASTTSYTRNLNRLRHRALKQL